MARVIKILFYIFAIVIFIWAFLAFILATIGLETKRFNPIIIEQVKKYNEDLDLDIKKVKVYLHIGIANPSTDLISSLTNPKLRISSKDPTLILNKHKIELELVETEIDIFSYFIVINCVPKLLTSWYRKCIIR